MELQHRFIPNSWRSAWAAVSKNCVASYRSAFLERRPHVGLICLGIAMLQTVCCPFVIAYAQANQFIASFPGEDS